MCWVGTRWEWGRRDRRRTFLSSHNRQRRPTMQGLVRSNFSVDTSTSNNPSCRWKVRNSHGRHPSPILRHRNTFHHRTTTSSRWDRTLTRCEKTLLLLALQISRNILTWIMIYRLIVIITCRMRGSRMSSWRRFRGMTKVWVSTIRRRFRIRRNRRGKVRGRTWIRGWIPLRINDKRTQKLINGLLCLFFDNFWWDNKCLKWLFGVQLIESFFKFFFFYITLSLSIWFHYEAVSVILSTTKIILF